MVGSDRQHTTRIVVDSYNPLINSIGYYVRNMITPNILYSTVMHTLSFKRTIKKVMTEKLLLRTQWILQCFLIESTKTTSMEDVSIGVLEKNKEYLRSKDKAKKWYDASRHM